MKKVILIGDSIRMGYQETVRNLLADCADVWGPEQNGGNSENVGAHLDEWVISRRPDIVHLNCGLHDLRKDFGRHTAAVPLEQYEENIRNILSRLQTNTNAVVIWASTTPVNEKWHHATKGFDRLEADVAAYNACAQRVAGALNVAVNDLFSVIQSAGCDRILCEDGVHFKPEGSAILGKSAAEFIKGFLRTDN